MFEAVLLLFCYVIPAQCMVGFDYYLEYSWIDLVIFLIRGLVRFVTGNQLKLAKLNSVEHEIPESLA